MAIPCRSPSSTITLFKYTRMLGPVSSTIKLTISCVISLLWKWSLSRETTPTFCFSLMNLAGLCFGLLLKVLFLLIIKPDPMIIRRHFTRDLQPNKNSNSFQVSTIILISSIPKPSYSSQFLLKSLFWRFAGPREKFYFYHLLNKSPSLISILTSLALLEEKIHSLESFNKKSRKLFYASIKLILKIFNV